jgi:hypothetical protein
LRQLLNLTSCIVALDLVATTGAGVNTDFVFMELEEAVLVIADAGISIQVPVTRMDAMGLSMPLSVLESARINSRDVLVPYRQGFTER